MTITYKLMPGGMVRRLPDNADIPNDPRNGDWQLYQKWLESGNTPQPMN